MTTMWICGKRTDTWGAWQFQGVFTTEDLAVKACVNRSYFIGPVSLNKLVPDDAIEWPGAYFPLELKDLS